jgi:hypothetical protein
VQFRHMRRNSLETRQSRVPMRVENGFTLGDADIIPALATVEFERCEQIKILNACFRDVTKPRSKLEGKEMDSGSIALHRHRIEYAHKADKPQKLVPGTAQLTYYIFEGVLTGIIGTEVIHVTALSGGGGGSKAHAAHDSTNNPYQYALKEVGDKNSRTHVHGGPIPPGPYHILLPVVDANLGPCAKLHPLFTLPGHRGGMAIHGRGPHGSDGCIVLPYNHDDLVAWLKKLTKAGGGHLQVCEAMEDSAFA